MLPPHLLEPIISLVGNHERDKISDYRSEAVAGGDINTSYLLTTSCRTYFVKTLNQPNATIMHQTEARGLQALAQTHSLEVPEVIGDGAVDGTSFLVLQGLRLGGPRDWQALGRGLQAIHRHTASHFGWPETNFIGTAPQYNTEHTHWREFWWQLRLLPQLELAYSNGYRHPLESVAKVLPPICDRLLSQHQPPASLVHGDLWAGNVGFLSDARPVLFDPACYYGDREVDLAMTHLFGGFSEDFYRAYYAEWPLKAGYQHRFILYNLYHLLNHLNLFGRGYLDQCVHSIKQLHQVL